MADRIVVDVTSTGDVEIIRQVKEYKIKIYKIEITNNSSYDATVSIIDRVTVNTNNYDETIDSTTITAGSTYTYEPSEPIKIDGSLYINTDQQPLEVKVEYEYVL